MGHLCVRPHRVRFAPSALWADLTPAEWLIRKMGQNLHMQTATWLVSRKLCEAAGPWNTELAVDDDGEYFCRVLLASEGTRFVPTAHVLYRMSGYDRLSYIGRSDRKVESMFDSVRLHIGYLRSLDDSDWARAACVNYLQTWLPNFYPERPDLVAQATQMAAGLGGNLRVPPAILEVCVDRMAPRLANREAREDSDAALPVDRGPVLGSAAVPIGRSTQCAVSRSVAVERTRGVLGAVRVTTLAETDKINVGDVPLLSDLKRRTARGALISTVAQVGTFVLRIGSLIVMARLLLKEDFGLVNMVTAFIGVFGLLREGLSAATVQRVSLTGAQASAIFWLNLAIGGLLAAASGLMAPLLVVFYKEPQLFWITLALGTIPLFSGATTQHRAMLQRGMRFGALAVVDLASLLLSVALGVGMALAGFGYWSLVASAVSQPLASGVGAWVATGWIPESPRRGSGIRSMLAFGGAVTASSLLTYAAFNLDKVLIGRVWGVVSLGVYGRAYTLISMPNENLYSTIGSVAFPALARVQNDPIRLRTYFLKGYGLFLSLVLPITVSCVLFADDIILVFLGPRWHDAATVFRLLAPAILVFAFTNPFAWLMLATGRAGRNAWICLAVTPVLVIGYSLGLSEGPVGVATGFSAALSVSFLPVIYWATRGTLITLADVLRAARPALVSIVLGASASLALQSLIELMDAGFWRLVVESAVLIGVYLVALIFVMRQRPVYAALLREMGLFPLDGWRIGGRKA